MSADTDALMASVVEAIEERLSPATAAHSRRVADTAAGVARAYGADERLAYLAGLLHDWSKDTGDEDLIAAARRRGMEIREEDLAVPYLLHARVGAAEVKEAFPRLPDDVIDAIARHTLGAAEMGPLDASLFLADMIEPERSYEGVHVLREAVGEMPVEELLLLGYERTICHVLESRRLLHPAALDAWNGAVAAGKTRP